jgi:site-specific DNA recombinase
VITLHPAALDRYRADLDRLAALLPRPDLAVGSELEDSVHALISAIIIRAPANSEMLEIEIRGRLDELLQAPTFPRLSAGGWW